MIQAYVEKVTFLDDLEITLATDSILVVIGPNNSGKSATLNDIFKGIETGKPVITVKGVLLNKVTPYEELRDFILQYAQAGERLNISGSQISLQNVEVLWKTFPGVGVLSKLLVSNLSTRERLGDCDPVPSFDARLPFGATHPFQYMYRDDTLEAAASKVVRRAFKKDLIIHRSASQKIPAYVGQKPKLRRGEDRFSRRYVDELEKLDPLEEQGDGIRSFVSVVGRILTESRPIQFIDEPEAFLHPPQAKLIAEEIARNSRGRQTFVATHSSNVLQGLISADPRRISVVRLNRDGISRANYLSNAEICLLWRDPILQFSNILDGLFHDGVIVTEADADCRFYEALAGASIPAEDLPDIQYTYSGGKDRIPVVVRALAALKVPVATIVDFDVLNSLNPLRGIVEAHGGDWSQIEGDWHIVKEAVESTANFLDGNKFRAEIHQIIESYGEDTVVPRDVIRRIKKAARNASPWDRAKDSGVMAIAPGQVTVVVNRLMQELSKLGIFVISVGEMEGFCRSVAGHGPRWVEEVLKRDISSDYELANAREFSRNVVAWINKRRRQI